MNEPHAYLFGDGSCGANDDLGAWASIAVSAQGDRKLLYGVANPTTISRCELMPIIEGIRWIHKNWAPKTPGYRLNVYCDSDYTVKTLNGEYTSGKNTELWQAAFELVKLPIQYKFIWVARNTLPYMELCDGIAGAIRKHNIAQAPKLFNEFDHRHAIEAVPVEPLPDDQPIIAPEITCLKQHLGGSSTPPIPS